MNSYATSILILFILSEEIAIFEYCTFITFSLIPQITLNTQSSLILLTTRAANDPEGILASQIQVSF